MNCIAAGRRTIERRQGMSEYILEMRGITKTFPGVKALDNVNFKVRRGEIHCRRRKRSRKINTDEGPLRRLPARNL